MENHLNYREIQLQIPPELYSPQEDTDLCADWLSEWASIAVPSPKVLEIGCGPGTLLLYLAKCLLREQKVPTLIGIDIDPRAIQAANTNADLNGYRSYIQFYQGDLFAPLPPTQFDLIYFNPPYLPGEEDLIHSSTRQPSDIIWEGGPNGDEVLLAFISTMPPFLKSNGQFMFISSSLVYQQRILDLLEQNRLKIIRSRKIHIFFEDIILYSGEKV